MNRQILNVAEPEVSVIMPVYNAGRYLKSAVESILSQSFSNWELILVNDGSTDGTVDALQCLSDARIRLFHNRSNIGYTRSILKALDEARGEYIARMDADDIAAPNRLQLQVDYLKSNKDIGIVGSSYQIIDEGDGLLGERFMPQSPAELKWWCLLHCPFAHPSVMFRSSLLGRFELRYDPDFEPAEDYDLWTRMLENTQGANLPDVLLRYRVHNLSTSSTRSLVQQAMHNKVSLRAIGGAIPSVDVSLSEVSSLRVLSAGSSLSSDDEAYRFDLLQKYIRILGAFHQAHPELPHIRSHQRRELTILLKQARPLKWTSGYISLLVQLFGMFPTAFIAAFIKSCRSRVSSLWF